MSQDSRPASRILRRAAPEPRPSAWAASLGADLSSLSDGASRGGSASEPVAAEATAATATATATAVATKPEALPAPITLAADDRQSLQSVLDELMGFDGSIGVALVDAQSGMVLGEAGSTGNLGLSAAGASVILRARLETNRALGVAEEIADVLITLSSQVQIIHPLATNSKLFLYLIGDKAKASLAMARYKATEADSNIHL
jgi:hypothetical protein